MIKTRKEEAAFTEDLNKTEDMLCNDPQQYGPSSPFINVFTQDQTINF